MKNRPPFKQALTFDDVLLVPQKSSILPKEVNLKQTVSDLSDAELDEQLSALIESSTNVKKLKQG